jgi:hypothetical protein
MPPDQYALIHRDARLTDEEADRLVAALEVLEGGRDGGGDDGRGRGGEDGDD